jgi:TRAP-type C4-dicarboxylate transport system permease small subunit
MGKSKTVYVTGGEMLRRVEKILHRVSEAFGWWGVLVCLVLTVLVTASAILRYGFSSPIYFTEDLSALLLMALFFLAMPYTFIKGRHVRITVVTGRLPPKARGWMEVVAMLAALCFLILFLRLAADYVFVSYRLGCRSESSGFYLPPWMTVMLVGPAVWGIVILLSVIQKVKALVAVNETVARAK